MDTKIILKKLESREIEPEQAKEQLSAMKLEEDSIAIIGMSGRYAQSDDIKEYWDNLSEGADCITDIPKARWDIKEYYNPQIGKEGKSYCNQIGLINNYEYFSPSFFEITPKEAEEMDPQHRLFLSEGYKAFEDAGYSQQKLNNKRCGVYLGIAESIANMGEKGISATGSSNAIAASRIAYYLNLKGPAIAIDTACSSSGVALHIAIQALHNGEIDMALVGGVCLYLQPEAYISMCATGMLSPSGRCKTFDNSADGFVPGEGVGTLILKKLRDAQRDHDHIYGCIIASGLNQDGKTNGITVPNLESQKELVATLYEKKNISPESITYAEFHGTGTKLGDPIELESLSEAFAKKTKKKHYCGIGSVKSNIGHTSAASAIASIQKVLLCMQHHMMVPTLHIKEPNEHFDFENSPFYINTERRVWKAKGEKPLRACINSFGFSGTNVHIVLQEYNKEEYRTSEHFTTQNIFILSAKNKQQLKEYAKNILGFVKKNHFNINDFFYTLQTGRTAMEERLAFIANGKGDLIEKLTAYVLNEDKEEWMLENHLTKNEIRLREASALENREVKIGIYRNLNEKTEYEKLLLLAKQWICGEPIDWEKSLYQNELPYKMSIPTYPFNEQAYLSKSATISTTNLLHPLVHYNISDFSKQCFESAFSGNEFFIADHKVNGKNLLPGAAMIEMARVAGEISSNQKVIKMTDIQWLLPVEVGEAGRTVNIILHQEEKFITFIITTDDSKEKEYAKGKMFTQTFYDNTDRKKIKLEEIINRNLKRLDHDMIYQPTKQSTISYGNSFQGIQEIYYNKAESLAHINVKDIYCNENYIIMPLILDCAMQAVTPLIISNIEHTINTYIPYSVGSIKVWDKIPNEVYSYVKAIDTASEIDKTFDIVITNTDGLVMLYMHNLVLKKIESKQEEKPKMVYLEPVWKEDCASTSNEVFQLKKNEAILLFGNEKLLCENIKYRLENPNQNPIVMISYGEKYKKMENNQYEINPCNQSDYERIFKELEEQGGMPSKIIISTYKNDTTENRIQYSFGTIVALGNALLNDNYKGTVDLLYRIEQNEEEAALSGMFKGIRKEVERFHFKTVLVEKGLSDKIVTDALLYEFDKNIDQEVWITSKSRMVRVFKEITIPEERKVQLAKPGGVYLITGGLGEIGQTFARYLSKSKDVHIILSGRRQADEKVREILKEIGRNDSDVKYIQSNIANENECNHLINGIKEQYGKIDGVIHAAGILKDALLWRKSLEDAKAVMAPKIYGTKYLDYAIGNDELDYMIFCSSLASSIGNIGQCDYCYANGFMDYFAQKRNEMVIKGLRKGKTISINWCPWKTSKMSVSDDFKKYIEKTLGMQALELEDGIQAFEDATKAGKSQFTVFKGNTNLIRKAFVGRSQDHQKEVNVEKHSNILGNDNYRKKIAEYLKSVISSQTKIPMDQIDMEESFGDYGIDSIVILGITHTIEKDFGVLPKTLFFEYNNLKKLTEYFFENYIQEFLDKINLNDNRTYINEKKHLISDVQLPTKIEKTQLQNQDSIAIIGMSGRYPMADNLEEFWSNLVEGRDCITEIPAERWDYRKYYDPNKEMYGKSYSKWGGFLNDVDKFDPLFFNISPVEAEFMDPQIRLSLESAWNAMEDAGYTRKMLASSRVGVFIGVMYGDYQHFVSKRGNAHLPATSSYSAIANRISYFFDFHGPSLAVDTMCSSSLTALHLACESIKRGEIDVAFVGGVNLSIHPNKYLTLSFGRFVSSDGHCRSFGEGGDGYVPGEGVGMLILKSIGDAERDNDHIYACIKGTAINSGGKTSGFTVPSPIAQSDVIKEVYEKSGIDIQSVSYVETHGTGTSLGDPIEINGLMKVFPKDGKKTQYCPIGSVKSNIGHLEGAAGIASITKVILQMQHNLLVPSLHSKELNHYIDFKNSPFYVQQEVSEWGKTKYEKDNIVYEIPRRAAISSFGAGGSNAHVLLEQYENMEDCEENDKEEVRLYLFSAKTKERLKEYIESFVNFINGKCIVKTSGLESHILEILQTSTGIPKEQFVVDQNLSEYGVDLTALPQLHDWIIQELGLPLNITELRSVFTLKQLFDYIKDKVEFNNPIGINAAYERNIAYTLQVGREAMEERLAISAKDLQDLRNKLLLWIKKEQNFIQHNILDYKENIEEIVEQATKTETIDQLIRRKDYNLLGELWTCGCNINWDSLYEKKPYKVPLPVYSFEKESFWVKAEDDEFFNIKNTNMLHPLVHKNISNIYGIQFETEFTGTECFLKDHQINGKTVVPGVVFLEMVRAAANLAINDIQEDEHISLCNVVWLSPAIVEDSKLTIFISFNPKNREELDFKVHNLSTQEIIYCTGTILICKNEESDYYDLKDLERETFCDEWNSKDVYLFLKKSGLEYGAYFQVIQYLRVNNKHAVSILKENNLISEGDFFLAPSITDAALHSCISFVLRQDKKTDDKNVLGLPFSVEKVDILRKSDSKMIAIIEEKNNIGSSENIRKYNIALYNTYGELCVKFNGLTTRKFIRNINDKEILDISNYKKILFKPFWGKKEMKIENLLQQNSVRRILLFTSSFFENSIFEKYYERGTIEIIDLKKGPIDEIYQKGTQLLLHTVKAMYKENHDKNMLIQLCIYSSNELDFILQGLSGFLKTIELEMPNIKGQILIISKTLEGPELCKCINEEALSTDSVVWIKEDKKRYTYQLEEIVPEEQEIQRVWKNNGVYLIVGGAGGLGLIMADEIQKHVEQVNIILTGRSSYNKDLEKKFEFLRKPGVSIDYIQADISKQEDVYFLTKKLEERFNKLDGIIYCAGVIHDNWIVKKTSDEMIQVLEPKVKGLYNLDQAMKDFDISLILLMSSSASITGNLGQSDYAAANGFMDSFAKYRNQLMESNQRKGITYSINWPLWREGGMQIDSETEKMIFEGTGLVPLEKEDAFSMLYYAINRKLLQIVPMEGQVETIKNWINVNC